MNSKVVIHIGPHKTGTSALQKFFFQNKLKLRERGLIYEPINQAWNNHHILAAAFIERHNVDIISDFISALIESGGDRVILFSSEMFCDAAFPVEEFIALFKDVELSIISYIRNPCDIVVSAFNEVVRDNRVRRREPIDELPWPYDPSLKDVLRRWLHPGLLICPYDPPQWKDGSIFSDFLSTINIDALGLDYPEHRENSSLSFPLVEIIRHSNLADLEDNLREELLGIVRRSSLPSLGYPLSRSFCDQCISLLRDEMDTYRTFFRNGMNEKYLLMNPYDS